MKLLAIESSCDETAAAVVENGRTVLSSVVASQIEEHKLYGGVVPEIASRRHSEAIVGVTKQALEQAHVTLKELDAIAVTYAPGLIGALLVGVNFAKGLALSTGLPLIPVHHLRSHIASNYITSPELLMGRAGAQPDKRQAEDHGGAGSKPKHQRPDDGQPRREPEPGRADGAHQGD